MDFHDYNQDAEVSVEFMHRFYLFCMIEISRTPEYSLGISQISEQLCIFACVSVLRNLAMSV